MGLISITDGTGYTTAAKVRAKANLNQTTDISTADLESLIVSASRILSRDIASRVFRETLQGTINGTNAVFRTKYPYLADRNLDAVVNASDVTVYTVKQDSGTDTVTRSSTTVSAVDGMTGKITLSSAPSASLADWVEADYEYYEVPVYTNALDLAAQALTAHLVHERNRDPSKVTMAQLKGSGSGSGVVNGVSRFTVDTRFLAEYRVLVDQIRTGNLKGAPRDVEEEPSAAFE